MENNAAKKAFEASGEFVIGATAPEQLPYADFPEAAFVGRSNVGKSSLINALFRNSKLARISSTPGCTRQINFYRFHEGRHIVDLPGYGYAKASRKEVSGWQSLMYDYLKGRPNLKRIYLLIDSRRGFKNSDIEMMRLLDDVAVSYQIIFTKNDKQKQDDKEGLLSQFKDAQTKHSALYPECIFTSVKNGKGIESLQEAIFLALL